MTGSATELPDGKSTTTANPRKSLNSRRAKPHRSKSAEMRRLLARKNGATISQLETELGWQPHTIRAAISRLRAGGAEVALDRDRKVPAYRLVTDG